MSSRLHVAKTWPRPRRSSHSASLIYLFYLPIAIVVADTQRRL